MKLITDVHISDFRSIQSQHLSVPGGFLPVVGANNSGKSNILRALNLFFRNEVEPGMPLRLISDFHNPSRNRKKEIQVEVHFVVPDYFNYRKNLRTGLDETLGRNFTIRKTWSYGEGRSPTGFDVRIGVKKAGEGDFTPVGIEVEPRIGQFLNLIRFRYHPNHIHPSDILRREQPELQAALLFRLNRARDSKLKDLEPVFERMAGVAADLMDPISARLKRATPHVEGVEFSMPKELGDLLFSFVPNIRVTGGEQFEALQHGSGVQSYLTYLMLAFLDTQFAAQFGWQQATIWAIEEPESFLHQELQHRLAAFLSELGEGERTQVFCTTHSDVVLRYSKKGVMCRLNMGRTEWRVHHARILCGEAAKAGVSPFVHPLLFSSQKPLLLVEGETDRRYVDLAYQLFGRPNPWTVRNILALDDSAHLQGIDGLRTYLSANRTVLGTRPLDAPCVVLVDWNENKKKVAGLTKELGEHSTSSVIQWEERECNPDLDHSFAGIERSLSTEVIQAAEREGILSTLRPSGGELPLVLVKSSLKKVQLVDFVEKRANREDVELFKRLLDRLDRRLAESVAEAKRVMVGDLFPDAHEL